MRVHVRSIPRGIRRRTAYPAAVLLLAALLATFTGPVSAQTAPPPDPNEDPTELVPAVDQPRDGDPDSPVAVLPALITELATLAERPPPGAERGRQGRIKQGLRSVEQALVEYADGSTDLPAVIRELSQGARHLEAGGANDAQNRRLDAIAAVLASVAKNLAVDMFNLATSAGLDGRRLEAARSQLALGDSLQAAGDSAGAAGAYGEGLKIASDGLHFDLDVFEQGIQVIAPLVIGYAYTINQAGQPVRSGFAGDARTAADDPETDHSPAKEQFLASVSKTITGVAMLRVLQDRKIPVNSSIAPYLPTLWPAHASLASVRFRDLLNHTSGIAGNQSNSYTNLRTRVGQSFPATPAPYQYSNANFGLMRILIGRMVLPANALLIADLLDSNILFWSGAAQLYAETFENFVRNTIFAPIGIDGRCRSTDVNDTRQYNWPPDGQPGYVEPDRLLSCGGFGWFLSSNELGAFMAHLRYTGTLLKAETRKEMDTLFLGWLDPTQFGWSTGTFGLYHNHGGDWFHAPGEAHTCIMKFPINVEVSVVINSGRNFARHQCTILRDAFDAAWVA